MAIWFDGIPLEHAQGLGRDTLIAHLGIELLEAGEDFLRARMPVDARTRQPAGVLHGGASVALAETLASWAATYCVDRSKNHCVGLEINANHVRPVPEGYVYGIARPIHLGRSTHIWRSGSPPRMTSWCASPGSPWRCSTPRIDTPASAAVHSGNRRLVV
jgi:1,4-dihydroxy-2-naphthoyl-CoA hydrolase